MTNNVSPLRYPGGKTRACKIIDGILNDNFDLRNFDTLVSPFFGGCSFEFYFQNKYNYKLIVNDKFKPLFNFWKQIKKNKEELCDELDKIPIVSKELFTDYRKTIITLNDNEETSLQQAIQYFIINRCSFSGSTLSGGFSQEASAKRYTPSSINKIRSLDFSNIEIFNYDFEEFINIYGDQEKSLLFLDPPYYLEKQSKLYGNNGDMHENFNHNQLYDLIKTKKNWLITYNNCDYIRDLYKDYKILEVDWKYGMNKTKTSSEIIILSNNHRIPF
uniref:site-specific DNA-methyltransferase (adenine-specific) n=1 Tax=viral metagenome TaxID=1070528 RepID=A0A6C0CGW2_9ZZZZ